MDVRLHSSHISGIILRQLYKGIAQVLSCMLYGGRRVYQQSSSCFVYSLLSGCLLNSHIGRCCSADDIGMDLPIDNIDNPFCANTNWPILE